MQGGATERCADCREHPPAWTAARAALRYDDQARRILLPFKYSDRVETARALAPLTRLLALTRPLLGPGGCAYIIKGTDADKEVLDAQRHFDFALTRHQTHGSVVLEVSSIEPIQCPPAS